MKVLLCFATRLEMLALENQLEAKYQSKGKGVYWGKNLSIQLLVSGAGVPSTIFYLQNILINNDYDLVINAGIAGAISSKLFLGEVVQVGRDRFADLGVEEREGDFTDIFELGLNEKNAPPYQDGWIVNNSDGFSFLKNVAGITVNKVHGSKQSIDALKNRLPEAEIESMEGAGVAFVCTLLKKPYLQIRAVSNYVEPRNRANWEIEKALSNLTDVLLELLTSLSSLPS